MECFLLFSQELATGPCPDADETNPQYHILCTKYLLHIIPPSK